MNAIAKRTTTVATAVVLLGAVAACQNTGQKTQIGAAGGAAAGGLLAAASGGGAAGIAAGVLLGGLAGGALGNYLDQRDQELAAQNYQQGLNSSQTGQTTQWVNPDSGHSGTIQPTRTYQTSSGQYCRDFQQTVTVNGRTETATGTACRQSDGTWKVV
jgi:surface antigen